jgi:hypothetical protein
MLEVALDPFGQPLNTAQCLEVAFTSSLVRTGASFVTACFGSALAISWGLARGCRPWQLEDLHLMLVLRQLGLHRLAVVHPQIVQDQVDLAPGILDQAAQKVSGSLRDLHVEGGPSLGMEMNASGRGAS